MASPGMPCCPTGPVGAPWFPDTPNHTA